MVFQIKSQVKKDLKRLKNRKKDKQRESTTQEWEKILEKAREQERKLKTLRHSQVKKRSSEGTVIANCVQTVRIIKTLRPSTNVSQKKSKPKTDWKKKALVKRFGSYEKEKLYNFRASFALNID